MRPYPWVERKRFTANTKFGTALSKAVLPLTALAVPLNPVSVIPRFWATRRFHVKNDAWYKRGLITIVVGLVVTLILGASLTGLAAAWNDLLLSFGTKATMSTSDAVRGCLHQGTGYALVLVGIAALFQSYHYEYASQRFLKRTKPTVTMKARYRRNVKRLATGHGAGDGHVKFGVIADDVIPWRSPRYGRIVQRPVEALGHGCITGTSGTGKTILASNLAFWVASNDGAVVYLDFKASLKTLKAVKAVAQRASVPFASFDVGLGSRERTWYDPLAWNGTASQKASMLIESFQFPDSGAASYYRNKAEEWMPLQFEVMDRVGLAPGESRFDFLHDTASPAGLRERFAPLREGTPADRNTYTEWDRRAASVAAPDLSNLRANLARVRNAGGDRLRPPKDGSPAVSLGETAANGGIIYIGLSPATDATALRVIGSLALRDLTVVSGLRSGGKTPITRPMLALVDEASRLGDRATVMEDLFATAREASVFVWPITQSYAAWPAKTHSEIATNALTQCAFRLQDNGTAAELTESLETIPALSEMTQEQFGHHAFRDRDVATEGDGRVHLERGPYLRSDALLTVADQHAHIWFTGSQTRPTKERWRSLRVHKDSIRSDAPLVRIVPVDIVLPENLNLNDSFEDLVADFNYDDPEPLPGASNSPDEVYALSDGASHALTPEQRAHLRRTDNTPTMDVPDGHEATANDTDRSGHDAAQAEEDGQGSGPAPIPADGTDRRHPDDASAADSGQPRTPPTPTDIPDRRQIGGSHPDRDNATKKPSRQRRGDSFRTAVVSDPPAGQAPNTPVRNEHTGTPITSHHQMAPHNDSTLSHGGNIGGETSGGPDANIGGDGEWDDMDAPDLPVDTTPHGPARSGAANGQPTETRNDDAEDWDAGPDVDA